MNILFVSNTNQNNRPYLDPSVRYRCYNQAEELIKRKHIVDVISFKNFELDMVMNYDVFIFHRPFYNGKLEAALSIMDKYKKEYYADYDDLTFAPEYALESSLFKTGRAAEEDVLNLFEKNYKANLLFKNFFVSTTPLKEIILDINADANVNVIHNGLSSLWVNKIKKNTFPKFKNEKTIAYFSGTKSHDHDFEIVEDVLSDFLNEYENYRLMIVGPLAFDESKFEGQLTKIDYVEYERLPKLISQTWINIAPLEENIFNKCKSGLKFFEAAIMGIPTIATPIPDFQRFNESEIILPSTSEEWLNALNQLASNEDIASTANKLIDYANNNCLVSLQVDEMEKIILKGQI